MISIFRRIRFTWRKYRIKKLIFALAYSEYPFDDAFMDSMLSNYATLRHYPLGEMGVLLYALYLDSERFPQKYTVKFIAVLKRAVALTDTLCNRSTMLHRLLGRKRNQCLAELQYTLAQQKQSRQPLWDFEEVLIRDLINRGTWFYHY
ncbi:hypothetical protein [Exercitatus varius]|uniref:hypothetical protein n=1 Tax=Exercitatus varius TaxID=67857 RepID=UPI00294ADC11|nr:hypothetical protein [Exercitatus varius]MDG2961725.1 hypothetical protein [Exercitatus varius]